MRVALVGPLPPLRGGISHYNSSLLAALREQGHDVLPISFRRLYPSFLFPGTSEADPDSRPPDGSLPLLVPWNPFTWAAARRQLAAHGPERTVVHLWHPFFVPTLLALAGGRAGQLTVIAHNVLPHEKEWAGRLVNPALFRRAERVLVGGRNELEALRGLAPAARGEVAPHPVYDRFGGIPDLQRRRQEAREHLGVKADEVFFVHLGLVRPYKGVDILLEAVARLKRDRVRVAIAGEFYMPPEPLLQRAAQQDVAKQVTLLNRYLSDDEVAEYLLAADALVLPYRRATQSGMAMAALALGTPVLASRTGALEDVIVEGGNGLLFAPGDPDDAAEAMESFLRRGPEEWRSKRTEIAEEARRIYSWERLASRVLGEL